jgi:hypothetical protein
MDHTTRAVLAQRQVGGAPEEVPAFVPLLADLDLAGTLVTANALQTHPEAAEFLVTGEQAHYLFVVKANQPTLLDRCASLPWHRVPVADAPTTAATAAHPQRGLGQPMPRTPARSAPVPPRMSWRPCATWPPACCAGRGRSTSPPRPRPTPAPCHPGISLG